MSLNNQKSFLLVITIAVCMVIILYVFFILFNKIDKLSNSNEQLEHMIDLKDGKIKAMITKNIFQYANEGIKLDPQIKIKTDTTEISLKKIIDEKKTSSTVVLRYSEMHCKSCVDDQVKFLKILSQKISSENIIILANYRHRKDLTIFKRMNQLSDINIYQVDSLNITIEDLGVPYVFILENMRVQSIFIPDNEFPELSENYYDIILSRFFNSSLE